MKELLMGNEAIAMGALAAGVKIVTGYPGTPSTEVLETVAKRNPGHVYVEWSVNEKSALEVAAGAAYAGARAMVTMKQVGLNVASDPLMSLNYIGVKGGLVLVVADDPGPISSQTEQDTRRFGGYSKVPVFDPSSPAEAYAMVKEAFAYSEKYETPVILRPTTRVCHSCEGVEVEPIPAPAPIPGFERDTRWVIFPRLAYLAKQKLVERERILGDDFSSYDKNTLAGEGELGIAGGGISYAYVKDALDRIGVNTKLFKVSTPYPFPEKKAMEFVAGLKSVLVIEELDPVIEDALIMIAGQKHLSIDILGKRTGHSQNAGENTAASVEAALRAYLNKPNTAVPSQMDAPPPLAVRPPVLCAGCPHRGSFYAVKKAVKGKKAVFSGDIGCYTLGNAAPLNMVDTCLCMGAGLTIAQGLHRVEPDAVNFAFIGDSTFFHTGIPGVINAVYNEADVVIVVLDNSTTAMTGQQPHPGLGNTMMGTITEKVSIRALLQASGVKSIRTANPFDYAEAKRVAEEAANETGVRAIIYEAPCIAVRKMGAPYQVNEDKCIGCKKCIGELGCPAITMENKKARIDKSLCTGCGLCAQVCPVRCIEGGDAR